MLFHCVTDLSATAGHKSRSIFHMSKKGTPFHLMSNVFPYYSALSYESHFYMCVCLSQSQMRGMGERGMGTYLFNYLQEGFNVLFMGLI